MIRTLDHAHPVLRVRFEALKGLWDQAHPTEHLQITCVWRSRDEQALLYAQGRTAPGDVVTWTRVSRHNLMPSRAIDVCILVDGVGLCSTTSKAHVASWENAKYAPLGPLCETVGLIWGGAWLHHDRCHIQLPDDVPQRGAA